MMEINPIFISSKYGNSEEYKRNPDCINYDSCRNKAAKDDTHLDCSQCSLENDKSEKLKT